MKLKLMMMFLEQLLGLLSPETIKNVIDSGLNWVEDYISNTENKYDDAAIFPIINLIRTILGIPDKDASGANISTEVFVEGQINKTGIVTTLVSSLLSVMNPEMIKGFMDAGLDVAEKIIADSATPYDDSICLPVISLIRTSFDIPDNDK